MEKRKRAITIIAILVAILAVLGVAYYTGQANHSVKTSVNKVAKKGPTIDQKVDKLSIKQVAGLIIAYSHLKYKKNADWKDVYKQALEKGVTVKKYKGKYAFENYTVHAPKKSVVYVINKKVVFTISNTKKKSKATIMIGDSSHELGQSKLTSAYKYVTKDAEGREIWDEIDENLDVDKETSTQEDNNEEQTQVSSKQPEMKDSNSNNGDLPLVNIPAAFQGTWYGINCYSDDSAGESAPPLVITNHTIEGKKLYSQEGRSPQGEKAYEQMVEKYKNDYVTLVHPTNYISFTPGGQQIDAKFMQLRTINGEQALVTAQQGVIIGIYFKNPNSIKKYSDLSFDELQKLGGNDRSSEDSSED